MGAEKFDANFRRCRSRHSTKRPKCAKGTAGLVEHSDHGWQYVSIVYNERLPSVESRRPLGQEATVMRMR